MWTIGCAWNLWRLFLSISNIREKCWYVLVYSCWQSVTQHLGRLISHRSVPIHTCRGSQQAGRHWFCKKAGVMHEQILQTDEWSILSSAGVSVTTVYNTWNSFTMRGTGKTPKKKEYGKIRSRSMKMFSFSILNPTCPSLEPFIIWNNVIFCINSNKPEVFDDLFFHCLLSLWCWEGSQS